MSTYFCDDGNSELKKGGERDIPLMLALALRWLHSKKRRPGHRRRRLDNQQQLLAGRR